MTDVADAADVSIATVSAFLNNTTVVSAELTARIEAAIRSTGYTPNAIARSLKTGSTRTIGLTVADIRNPFFTDVVATIQQALNNAGYAVMLCSNEESTGQQDQQIKLLLDRMVDGLIIAPAGEDQLMRELISSTKKPVVLIDRTCDGLDVDSVTLDNAGAVYDAVDYLIRLGHRRIGFMSGPMQASTGRDRLAGYRRAIEDHGIPFEPSLIGEGNYQDAAAYRATLSLLSSSHRPTALFSANNLMVIGAMRAIHDMGLNCPKDISIACMDDFPWSNVFSPRLTTVAQPVEAIGEHAARLLLDRLNGTNVKEPRRLVLQGRLITRSSCMPLRG
jgi:LacI family transcriptional regulator